MANTSAADNSYCAARRSTRRDQAVLITVSGVDSRRGPYSEKVSTLIISCHGCKYPSKYQVLPDAWVTLELTVKKTRWEGSNLVVESALKTLEQKARTSGEFANELTHYSRSHLEFVSGAIAELAEGIGKLSKD